MSEKDRQHPPCIGEKLFRWILPEAEKQILPGDYEEQYKYLARSRGSHRQLLVLASIAHPDTHSHL